MALYLRETLTSNQAQLVTESEDGKDGSKNLYMKGIFIEGGVKNANQRVYPVNEIEKAVTAITEQIKSGYSVLGEVDHPDDLKINLDRVSHMITDMWMDGPCGYGKLKVLPTPMGKMVQSMSDAGVMLGVSSRGSGDVNEASGHVSNFDIITVDIVAQPSAPDAYPKTIYESLFNMRGGSMIHEIAKDYTHGNPNAEKHLTKQIVNFINELKLR